MAFSYTILYFTEIDITPIYNYRSILKRILWDRLLILKYLAISILFRIFKTSSIERGYCYKNNISHANARWTSIRFKELIATYGYHRDSRGLLENSIGILLRPNLYRGIGADKLSTNNKQEKETSYIYSVVHVTGSPVTGIYY